MPLTQLNFFCFFLFFNLSSFFKMPFYWARNSHGFTQQDHQNPLEEYNPTSRNDSSNQNREKPKSFDETILLARNSPRGSHDFKAASIYFNGSSVFWGSDSDTGSKIVDKKAYPLPQPSVSSESFTRINQRVDGFGSETTSLSSTCSSGSSSFDDGDPGDFGSFRSVEETNCNSCSRTSCPQSKASTTHTSAWQPLLWDASLASPTQKNENLKHPCHPLPLPPSSPIRPSLHLQSKWKKGRLLGRGTFGHVYAGFDSESGQMCAIKEVRVISDDQTSKECYKQLNQEIALLSELSHPNIVQYYGSELGGDKLSVYLEYVSGGSVHKLLKEYGPFKEPVIQSYTRQILSGLAYLHQRNTVHRDIKGANILVDPNGEIKLADFGMAKHITSCSSNLSFKGSPYWMAPEVIMNSNGYSFAVDIWSLGCTVLEMSTSKPPWNQYEGVAAIFKIANSKDFPEIPNYLSEDAQSFIKLCLQRNPSARPTAAQLLHHPFIQEQVTRKVPKVNLVDEALPSTLDGRYSMAASHFHSKRSSSTEDRDLKTTNHQTFKIVE